MPSGLAEKVLATRGRIDGERKQVAVLFCDLVSSATIAEGMDPEEFRDLLDRYLAVVFDEVSKGEGLVNQIAGDGVMALFGAPLAHEDAPERAVRAAIEIRDGLARLSETLRAEGRPALTARIGLNAGPVIVGTVGGDLKLDYTAIGDTTNLAARLQSMARPGAILLSEALERLVREEFVLTDLGPKPIRGKALPVRVFEVERARAVKTPLSGRAPRSEAFVGRELELRTLREIFEQAEQGRGQAVGIVGHAGVGASRLLAELVGRLEESPCTVLWAQCFSYTQRSAYRPFADVLRHHVAPESGLDEDVMGHVLRRLAESPASTSDAPEALARLLGVALAGTRALDGDELRHATIDAVTAFLLDESRRAPLVLVVEDAQWIDDASRELLNALVERAGDARVLVVSTYRPDEPAPWESASEIQEIELGSLSRDETAAIIRTLGGGEPSPDVVDAVFDRAEGNPFFTEEVTRELLDTGVLVDGGDGALMARSLPDFEVPVTVHEIVAARLDRLPVEEKRALQVASVMGRRFSAGLVERLLAPVGIDAPEKLRALQEAGVIRLSTTGASDDFVFVQALTQEVAYEGLLRKQRRELHRQVADALAEHHGDEPGEHSAVLAYHYRNGDSHGEALEHLLDAGRHAETVPAYGTAAGLYRQAWEIARRRADDETTARKALRSAKRLLWLAAVFGEGSSAVVESLGDEIEPLLERVGEPEDRIAVGTFEGFLRVFGAAEHHVSGLERLDHAHELARHHGEAEWSWRVRRGLAVGYALDGRFDAAEACAREVLEEIEASGRGDEVAALRLWARATRDAVHLYRDDLGAALVGASQTFEQAGRAGNRSVRIMAAGHVATVLLLQGELEDASRWAREGLALAAAVGSRGGVPNLAAIAVLAGRRLGETEDEARWLRQIELHLNGAAGIQQSLGFATEAFLAAGLIDRAERVAQGVRRRAGGRLRRAESARDVAGVAMAKADWKKADYFLEESERVAREIGARSTLARVLRDRGAWLEQQGEAEAARACTAEGGALAAEVGLAWGFPAAGRV